MTLGAWTDWTLARRLRVTLAGLFVLLLLAEVALLVSLRRADDATSEQVKVTVPARLAASQLLTSLVDQETGLRGYALTGDKNFLAPYRQGLLDEEHARAELERLIRPGDPARLDLLSVDAAITAWRGQYASLRTDGPPGTGIDDTIEFGRQLFDRVRLTNADLDAALTDQQGSAQAAADRDRRVVAVVLALMALTFVVAVVAAPACAEQIGAPTAAAPRRAGAGGGPRRAHDLDRDGRLARPARDRRRRRVHASGARGRAGGGGAAAASPGAPGRRARAIERGPRAVRLRRVPRPPGTAAQGRQLLPAARAAVRGPARRTRRRVHRVRRRRRETDAAAHQRPAHVQPRGAHQPGIRRRRSRGRRRHRMEGARRPGEAHGRDTRGGHRSRGGLRPRRSSVAPDAAHQPVRQLDQVPPSGAWRRPCA